MKRQALERVIDEHVHKMKKHSEAIPGSFAADDIHDMRVEYKKMRAFLRLLQLQVPADVKALYRAAGKVRDLQIFLENFPIAAPCFIEYRQRQLFRRKEALVVAVEKMNFKKVQHTIHKALPHQLEDTTRKKFIDQKVATIHIILQVAEGESDLHDTRKQVKDIIYTRKLDKKEEPLADIATQLGAFNDRCHALAILKHTEQLPEEEKQVIQQLQQAWTIEKEQQQRELLQQLQQLPITYTH